MGETLEARGRLPLLSRLTAGLHSDSALYFVLLLLVWGLTVPLRGLWQDDTQLLRWARVLQDRGFLAAFTPVPAAAPLRRLLSLPFRLALATPQPIWTLHLIFGLTWLGQALTAGWISGLLLPGRRLTRLLAICLTLTATSDYLTGNLTALGYNLAALLLLLALGCSLRYVTGGRAGWVVLACFAIAASIWASLAVAVLTGWAAQKWPRFRTGFLLLPVLFVGFGVWGGLERQDLWVSTWRLHQKELLSIVTSAPALKPGTGIILRSGPTPALYLATEADYLTRSWLLLLYDDTAIHSLRLAPDRGTGCHAAPEGLDCWHEQQAACFAAGTCAADHFPYETLVILDFDPRQGVWRLVSNAAGDSPGYRPTGRILNRPLTPRQRALLLQ